MNQTLTGRLVFCSRRQLPADSVSLTFSLRSSVNSRHKSPTIDGPASLLGPVRGSETVQEHRIVHRGQRCRCSAKLHISSLTFGELFQQSLPCLPLGVDVHPSGRLRLHGGPNTQADLIVAESRRSRRAKPRHNSSCDRGRPVGHGSSCCAARIPHQCQVQTQRSRWPCRRRDPSCSRTAFVGAPTSSHHNRSIDLRLVSSFQAFFKKLFGNVRLGMVSVCLVHPAKSSSTVILIKQLAVCFV